MANRIPKSVLYLVHTTNNDPTKYNELRAAKDIENQFPGVYFSLITTQNKDIENLYPGKYIMFFSPELLKQHNYHINIQDYNGFISEKNTYFPWSLDKAVKIIDKESKLESGKHSNEIVFHDDIPMTYLCKIIEKPSFINNTDAFLSFKLPAERCVNSTPPDISKLPFYVYSFEHRYTGIDPLQSSAPSFFRKMAKLSKIYPIPDSTKEIIRKLEEKAPYFLTNRNEQNINALRNNNSIGGYTRRKTRRVNTTSKKYIRK